MGKKIITKTIISGSDPKKHFGSINDPIFKNSTLIFNNYDEFVEAKKQKFNKPYYGRINTYTSKRFEKIMCSLYECSNSVLTSSGLSAIAISLTSFLSNGDEILITENCYEPVLNLANLHLKKFGIKHFFFSNDLGEFKKQINQKTKIIYLESPGSLNYEVQDLIEIVKIAKKKKIMTIIDNTWATFLGCNPLKFGIDIVIESATKYLSGHSDNFLGIIVTNSKVFGKIIKQNAVRVGDYVSSESCFNATKGIKTLSIRLEKHKINAQKVFNYLESHSYIEDIFFLPDVNNKFHKLWKKYFNLHNGLITF